jgi:ankyrin repeat protein
MLKKGSIQLYGGVLSGCIVCLLLWVLLGELRLLPLPLTRQFEAYFEWDSGGGFTTFKLEGPGNQIMGSGVWQNAVIAQIKPRLDAYLRQPGWKRINGHVRITVTKFVPVAYPTALGSDGEVLTDPDETPLMHAVDEGDIRLVTRLLASGASVNATDQRGQTALIHACVRGSGGVALIKVLLSAGADVNAQTTGGRTPLIVAAGLPGSEIVQELLAARADPNARDKKGNTALMIASEFGSLRTAQDLLTAGADPNARNDDGQTALSIARFKGRTEIAELLTPAHR